MFRRFVVATVLAGALLVPTAGAVFAHECTIVSRSDQGDAMVAAHSPKWDILTLETIFTQILPGELGQAPLTPSQLQWALGAAAQAGVPSSFVTRTDKTIGEGSSNPNLADGRGLDHLVDVYGNTVAGIYFAALQL